MTTHMRFFKTLTLALMASVFCMAAHAQFAVTIPYAMERGKMIVSAEVNGVKGRFVLDTGAPCALSSEFARKAGISPEQEITASDSNGNPVKTRVLMLGSLKLGATSFRKVQALELDMKDNPAFSLFHIDGLIGYTLLKMGALSIYGREHKAVFASAAPTDGDSNTRYVAMPPHPMLALVPLQIGNATDTVMFDSGEDRVYVMSRHKHDALAAQHTQGIRTLGEGMGFSSMGVGGVEAATRKVRVCTDTLALAGYKLANVCCIATDNPTSRIGTGLLAYGDITIDYIHNTFAFSPHTDTTPNLYQPDWDVVLTVTPDGWLRAGIVWDKRLAIQSGDRVVEVNGHRFDNKLDMREATTKSFTALSGNKAVIKFINKKGKEQKVVIKRR
mgnify:FL=1